MNKYIKDMTLQEVKDMCENTICAMCVLYRKKSSYYNESGCYLLMQIHPSEWHGTILNKPQTKGDIMPANKLPNGGYEVQKDPDERNQRIIDGLMSVVNSLYIPVPKEEEDEVRERYKKIIS